MVVLIAGPQKPPRSYQGLGLPYLAAVLEEDGCEVRICDLYPPSPDTDDLGVLDQRLAAEVAALAPAVVGVTVHTPMVAERTHLAACLRRHCPDALLVAGGHHPTAEPEDLLRHSEFDVCAIGEGENTLRDLARRAEANGRRGADAWLGRIAGVVWKQGDRIVANGPREPPADLDAMPVQAHHLLGLEAYGPHPNLGIRSTGLLTYRGCPMRCTFCLNSQGTQVRRRSPARVVDEMAQVVSEFGVTGFNCYDNLFGLDRRHAGAFCEEIESRNLDVTWECWSAGHLVDPALAGKMRAAGCVRVGFGVESGDDEVLRRNHRGMTAARHRAGLDALRSAGLKTEAFFMLGLPGESAQSVQRTVEFAKDCAADGVVLGVFRPYPGTAVWQNPDSFGVRLTRGPNYEAYVETETLSRAAILDCAEGAGVELERCGRQVGFLRCDRYAWE